MSSQGPAELHRDSITLRGSRTRHSSSGAAPFVDLTAQVAANSTSAGRRVDPAVSLSAPVPSKSTNAFWLVAACRVFVMALGHQEEPQTLRRSRQRLRHPHGRTGRLDGQRTGARRRILRVRITEQTVLQQSSMTTHQRGRAECTVTAVGAHTGPRSASRRRAAALPVTALTEPPSGRDFSPAPKMAYERHPRSPSPGPEPGYRETANS
jgi:hypothetical protein